MDNFEGRKKAREARHPAQEVRERERRRREDRQGRGPREAREEVAQSSLYSSITKGAVRDDYEERRRARETRHAFQEEREEGRRREDMQWRGRVNEGREDRQPRDRQDRQLRDREERQWRGSRDDKVSYHSLEQFPLLPRPGNGRRGVPAPRARA